MQSGTIFCGAELQHLFNEQILTKGYSKIFILTDSNTATYCLPRLTELVVFPLQPIVLQIPAGESHKHIASCMDLWRELATKGADRSSLLINLGGGVITDLGGFVASTFKRGFDFINIPTSLLAMVDAAIGGKTGVDLDGLKNQVGVISQARAVFIDTVFLETLPEREFYAGLAEMLKHGLIASPEHWNELKGLQNDSHELERLIWDSIMVKKDITEKDPTEKGLRKTLNFGHTIGHAVETYFLNQKPEDDQLLHGEAVAVGMLTEAILSSKMLGFPTARLDELAASIIPLFPKPSFNEEDMRSIIALLVHDKKNRGGKILFVLLEEIGKAVIDQEIPEALIYEALQDYSKLQKDSF
jgi:3-dehydroquinate synthase